jgi:hypothetical protein
MRCPEILIMRGAPQVEMQDLFHEDLVLKDLNFTQCPLRI